MIKSVKPLSLAETNEVLNDLEETEKVKAAKDYVKRFVKLKPVEMKEMKKELDLLGLMKMKEENAAKIMDIMPEDAEDVRKIFTEVSLDEDEISKILEVTKKHL